MSAAMRRDEGRAATKFTPLAMKRKNVGMAITSIRGVVSLIGSFAS